VSVSNLFGNRLTVFYSFLSY